VVRAAPPLRLEGGNTAAANSTLVDATGPIVAKNDLYPHALRIQHRGNTMQTKRTYQVQHWPNGQWNPEHNWRKVEAASEKEAAEKVCGLSLAAQGRLAQLRARVLTVGDLKQRSSTPFFAEE
jgi:hypothetical protein